MVKGVRSDIEVRRIAIADLRQTLNMTNFDESAFPQNSIALVGRRVWNLTLVSYVFMYLATLENV